MEIPDQTTSISTSTNLLDIWLKKKRGEEKKIIIDGENLQMAVEKLLSTHHLYKVKNKIVDLLRFFQKKWGVTEAVSFHSCNKGQLVNGFQSEIRNSFRKAGIDFQFISKNGYKDLVDSWVALEIFRTILDLKFGEILLFSGDVDYEAAITFVKEYNIELTIICSERNLSNYVKEKADNIYFLEEYL